MKIPMATDIAPPCSGISLLPSHLLECIMAVAGTGSGGAALSCRPLLTAWQAALARDPRLAAAILLERAAVISNPLSRRAWIFRQLFLHRVKGSPASAESKTMPSTVRRQVTKRQQLATEGLLVSPNGALVRAFASEQERADYATVLVRELPDQVMGHLRTKGSGLSTLKRVIGAPRCAGRSQQSAGAALELLLHGLQPWVLTAGACQALDARFLGACLAAERAFTRVHPLYPSRLAGLRAPSGTWQPSRDKLAEESFDFRGLGFLWLMGMLLRLQFNVVSGLRRCVANCRAASSCSSGVPVLRTHITAASATCVRLPASVTQSAARPPVYPATTTLATAVAVASFISYLAACSLDVYDPAFPPCHQRQPTCRTKGAASTRAPLPHSTPNPIAMQLYHHYPSPCPHCYTMAREAMQLPQTPATHGYCAVTRMGLERLMYGVQAPAATALGRVRQLYCEAKYAALSSLDEARGTGFEKVAWLMLVAQVAVTVVALLAFGAVVLGLVLLWGVVEVLSVPVELAVSALWWFVRWASAQLLGMVKRGLGRRRSGRGLADCSLAIALCTCCSALFALLTWSYA